MRALVTRRDEGGKVESEAGTVEEAALPEGDVLVDVAWSGLNYKDALCLNGLGNLVKTYPHVGGIDFAGRVVESGSPRYRPGDEVILTGWRVGELTWGGFAERARVRAEWLVPLPATLSARDAMVLGTAGLTAMLAIERLEGDGLEPARGPVLVTGAGGGVGSLAVLLLARLGYAVTAVTGKAELGAKLRGLGAAEVVTRDELLASSGRVLDKERWAAAIDPVGGPMLGEVLKKVRYGGAVAAIGAAASPTWEASVIPFILRAVTLFGIDSVMAPYERRVAAWARLGEVFPAADYAPLVTEARLEEVPALSRKMLEGGVAGRVIVTPQAAAG